MNIIHILQSDLVLGHLPGVQSVWGIWCVQLVTLDMRVEGKGCMVCSVGDVRYACEWCGVYGVFSWGR